MTATSRKKTQEPKRRRLRLDFTMNAEASERFRELPLKERDRILEEFKETFAPAFESTKDYLTERRRENERDA